MDSRVFDILSRGVEVEESDEESCYVRIPQKLDRDLYLGVDKVFKVYGGKWISGKTHAHLFPYPAADIQQFFATVIESGTLPSSNPLAFFFTPAGAAGYLLGSLSLSGEGQRVLEPSAGTGHLVDHILQEFDEPQITAVEIDPFRANVLRRKYADNPRVEVIEADFMRWAAGAYGRRQFDTVVMNPPFAVKEDSLAYVNHIALAWSLLGPEGQLASIVPSGINFQDSAFVKRLRQRMKQKGAVENLPELAFKEAGTCTRTAFCYGNKWVPPLVVRKEPAPPVLVDCLTGQMAFF